MKEHFKEQNSCNYLLFVLGINSALRISDLLSLAFTDVDVFLIFATFLADKTNKEKKYKISDGAKEALDYYLRTLSLRDIMDIARLNPTITFSLRREVHIVL